MVKTLRICVQLKQEQRNQEIATASSSNVQIQQIRLPPWSLHLLLPHGAPGHTNKFRAPYASIQHHIIILAEMPLTPGTPLQSAALPALDMSRYNLKQLAHWIRDDLDILVAREGPDILRPDDVLTLHELFVALRQATTITTRDLRATGIHKAVKDIAGIATRWPGRLCDDCDKIITMWTSKFGRLDELHPFLYGRGGRLEGIASVTEYTREVRSVYCVADRVYQQ
jgi:hypothetical protein